MRPKQCDEAVALLTVLVDAAEKARQEPEHLHWLAGKAHAWLARTRHRRVSTDI